MTLKQENGVALALAGLPVVVFLVLSDRLAETMYTHIGGPDGWFVSKASFAKFIWLFGVLEYGVCLSLRSRFETGLPRFSPAYLRFGASALLSVAVIALIISNLAH